MKRSQQCPKCDGKRLWVVEKFRIPSETAAGTELPLVTYQRPGTGLFVISRSEPKGRIDLWLCDGCGYTELWAAGLEGLRPDPDAGVRLSDATVEAAGPFR